MTTYLHWCVNIGATFVVVALGGLVTFLLFELWAEIDD
jgi:hypothetical protein